MKTILSQFNLFFLRKNFKRTKAEIKSKPTNKTKLSKQKTTKATIFRAQKLLRGGKLVILRFLKKINCPDNVIYYTTELCSIDFAVFKLLLTSFISTHKTLRPIRQDRRLSTYGTFKNAGSKPARGRFYSRGTLTSKEALDT